MSDDVSVYTQVSVVVALAGALLSTIVYIFSVSMPLLNNNINQFAATMESFPEYRLSSAQEASVNKTFAGIPRAEAGRVLSENKDEIFSVCYVYEVFRTAKKSDIAYDVKKAKTNSKYINNSYGKGSRWYSCWYPSTNSMYFCMSKYADVSVDEVIKRIVSNEDICDKVVIRYTKDYLNRIHVIVYPYEWTGYAEVIATNEMYRLPIVYPVTFETNAEYRDKFLDIQNMGRPEFITGIGCDV